MKPSWTWKRYGENHIATFGIFMLSVRCTGVAPFAWLVESDGGDNRHTGGSSPSLVEAKLAAESELARILNEAIDAMLEQEP